MKGNRRSRKTRPAPTSCYRSSQSCTSYRPVGPFALGGPSHLRRAKEATEGNQRCNRAAGGGAAGGCRAYAHHSVTALLSPHRGVKEIQTLGTDAHEHVLRLPRTRLWEPMAPAPICASAAIMVNAKSWCHTLLLRCPSSSSLSLSLSLSRSLLVPRTHKHKQRHAHSHTPTHTHLSRSGFLLCERAVRGDCVGFC